MELDNEVSGNGNSYTTEFRQYDPRLGRWKSLDPLMAQFPHMSPYCAFDNNPVYYVDPYGLSATNETEPPSGLPDTAKDGSVHEADNGNMYQWFEGEGWSLSRDGGIVKDSKYTRKDQLYTQPLNNHTTPDGGTITVPNCSYEQFNPNGEITSFAVDGEKYTYSTSDEGAYDGYKTNSGERYWGDGVWGLVPWYYSRLIFADNVDLSNWYVYSDPQDAQSEYEVDPFVTAGSRFIIWELKRRAQKKLFGDKKILPQPKGGDGTGIVVKSRTEYQFVEAREWIGYGYVNGANGHAYMVPLRLANSELIRVGVAKIRYKVFLNGVPTQIEKVDLIDAMETPTQMGFPTAPNGN